MVLPSDLGKLLDDRVKLVARMTDAELAEFDHLLLDTDTPWLPLPGPQVDAYESEADIIGYGGAAGGGKTDLICGASITKHKRVLVIRSEKAQTEGIMQRLTSLLGGTEGYNSQKGQWRVQTGSEPLIEFGGLDNPGDESRWQGRAHDLKCFDEVTEMREHQVRFCMGWNRSEDPGVKPKVLMTFNPPMDSDGEWVIRFFAPWLDDMHPNPAKPGELRWFTTIGDVVDVEVPDGRPFVVVDGEYVYKFNPDDYTPEQIVQPKSRTFIPARIVDNPYYMATGYIATLQSMPEPMRSRMLYGNFKIGREADPMQVIPVAWVDAAMKRWRKPDKMPPMDALGADVAMRGRDKTILARRHDMWFDEPVVHPGVECKDGPTIAGFMLGSARNNAPIQLDLFGVGSRPYGHLMQIGYQVLGINVGDTTEERDLTGHYRFRNLRSLLWWRMREALDPDNNTGIALPPDRYLRADLCAPKFKPVGPFLAVESRDEIVKRLGRSPDYGSAYVLALVRTPKLGVMQRAAREARGVTNDYDPFAQF